MNLYRSLVLTRLPDESLFKILERLAIEGYLRNNRKLKCSDSDDGSRMGELICSMENLETWDFDLDFNHELSPMALVQVFQSCAKITKLRIRADIDEIHNGI